MNISGIYGWYCTASDKWYVGQSIALTTRKCVHLASLRHNKSQHDHLQRAFNLYGEERFEFHILEELEEKHLSQAECFWIDWLQSTDRNYGYNSRQGGRSYGRHSEETRNKMVANHKGMTGRKHSLATKRKIAEANYGKIKSKATCRKISVAKRNPSDATRLKLSLSHTGKKRGAHSEETKLWLSLAAKSNTKRMEQCRKLGQSHRGKVYSSEIKKIMLDKRHKKFSSAC